MSHPERLRHDIGAVIAERSLWSAGDRVAVAVSGGLDSVCLLDVLVQTTGWHGGVLSVVTVDHGTRPDSSHDADFVEGLARAHGLPVHRATLTPGPDSSEAALRHSRYAVFDSLGVDRVALAHHQADLAETVLLHLLRGTGTTGLAGMAWRRGPYVRPLLTTSRERLVAWARQRALSYREDPSNREPRFLRNRIRHEVMPLLESLRSGAQAAIARSAAHAAADDQLLEGLADAIAPLIEADRLPVSWVLGHPEPLVRRVLLRRMPDLNAAQLDDVFRAARRGTGRVVTGAGVVLEVRDTTVEIVTPKRGG